MKHFSLASSKFLFPLTVGFMVLAPAGLVHADNTYVLDVEASSNQSAYTADTAALSLSSDYTLEAWIKLEAQPGSDTNFPILAKTDFSSNRGYSLYYSNIEDTKYLRAGISGDGTLTTYREVAQTLSDDVWYHIAFVYTASSTAGEFFVNGTSIGTVSGYPSSVFDSNRSFEIGTANSGDDGYFDGRIDDVRVWSIARTQADIASTSSVELTGSETGLVAYWKLNNSTSDSTANGQTLTLSNGATYAADVAFGGAPAPDIVSLTATPSSITASSSSTLAWNVTGATSLSIDQGVGSVAASSSTSVSPTVTTLYTITASNQGLATSTASVTVTVNAPQTIVRKATNESVQSSTALQNDDALALSVSGGKTYLIEGVIIASSTNGTPDIKIALTTPTGSSLAVGAIAVSAGQSDGGVLEASGAPSPRIQIPSNTATPIVVRGTLLTTNSGTLQLQWAQFASNASAMVVGKGSYLRVEEI